MSAMTKVVQRPPRHESIVGKIVDGNGSDDSDCVPDDEYNTHQILKTNIEESKQTITLTKSQPTNSTTVETSDDIFEKPNSTPSSLRERRPVSRGNIFFPPPNLDHHRKEQQSSLFSIPPSQSFYNLSHSRLQEQLTADSGIGDSIEHISTLTQTNDDEDDNSYDMVEIYGHNEAIGKMKKRYEFDEIKLDEYKRKQKFFKLPTSKQKPSITEHTLPLNKNNSNILSRLFKPFKQNSYDNTYSSQPVFRHHSSNSEHKEQE